MQNLRLIFIHGIDSQATNYSERLFQKILAACRATLAGQGRDDAEIDATLTRLVSHEIFWAELTTDLTNRYEQLAYRHPRFFWNALTKPIDPLAIQVMNYIKDKGNRDTGQMDILHGVDTDFRRGANPREHVIVVAHSLGSVIAFDYLMGFRRWRLDPSVTVKSFITMGSPIPIFTSAMGHADSDLVLPANVDRWVNIRSPRDAIARPMKPFFHRIEIDEHEVSTRFFPISAHTAYWQDDATAAIIASEALTALGTNR